MSKIGGLGFKLLSTISSITIQDGYGKVHLDAMFV